MEKWMPSKDAIKSVSGSKHLRIIIIPAIVIALVVIVAGLLMIFPSEKKPLDTNPNYNNQPDLSNNSIQSGGDIQYKPAKAADNTSLNRTEDLSDYINAAVNQTDKVDVSICIIDDTNNIASNITKVISDIYKRDANVNTNLFKRKFVKSKYFDLLFESDSEVIDKFNLQASSDYIVMGKFQNSLRNSELSQGSYVANAEALIAIISVKDARIVDSFTISGNANGVTEQQATESAINKMVSRYMEHYTTFN